ncbi:MAG TPA: nucleotidyltransferase family protein [Chthoniobacterales bacterium]
MKRNIAAIVLAAGSSSRMGEPKQLLRVGASTLLRRTLEQALASDAAFTVVVLGAQAHAIRRELEQLAIALIENARWSEGIGSSISAGVEAAKDCEAVVIIACDQPHLSAATINRLIAEHESSGKPIVASAYSDTLGVPALFAREFFDELRQLAPDEGAKRLLHEHRHAVAAVSFAEGAVDLDTPADYERFVAKRGSR